MNWIIITRVAITLTFLILASGGPWALVKLSRFIRLYTERHQALEQRVAALERKNTETL